MISTPPRGDLNNALVAELEARFSAGVSLERDHEECLSVRLRRAQALRDVCKFLFWEAGCFFGGLIVEERQHDWHLVYLFLHPGTGWIHVTLQAPLSVAIIPSITPAIHAADWYEREAEDLLGLRFEEHPRLGDFILHDQVWQEGIAPMRHAFDALQLRFERRPNPEWRPTLVVKDPGAFAMPVGPVYEGGLGESVHFLLETVGEDVIRAAPRLFYKYRAVEKIAEGRSVLDGVLLAERFAAKSAFAHSLAYCQAVENAARLDVPIRAMRLRVALSELERLRHHAGAIEAICQSTALNVSEAHAAIIEEQLLRASCRFTGHRYLFGLNMPGGLRRDFDEPACWTLLDAVDDAATQLHRLEHRLRLTSSFLDRLEDAGVVTTEAAHDLDLVGPIGRASGLANDLRKTSPYTGYGDYSFEIAKEPDGDGFARLRVLFFEAQQSAALVNLALKALQPGEVCTSDVQIVAGNAMGWAEAPIGATVHWLRLDEDGRIERYKILSPSFRNWLGLHVAVEDFAFQDFPIILATFGLSVAECDR